MASIREFFFFFCTVQGARSLKVPSGLVSGDASLAASSLYPTWTLLLHTGEKRVSKSSLVSKSSYEDTSPIRLGPHPCGLM